MANLPQVIESADIGQVWKLIQDGAQLDDVDPLCELTPLALAAESGSTEIVRMLLGAGADPDHGGLTTPLEAAVVGGHIEVTKALLETSVDVNHAVEEGFTPLMTAATTGSIPLVRLLLEAGARPRMTNDAGETAISLAESEGHDTIVKLLKTKRQRKSPAKKPKPKPTAHRVRDEAKRSPEEGQTKRSPRGGQTTGPPEAGQTRDAPGGGRTRLFPEEGRARLFPEEGRARLFPEGGQTKDSPAGGPTRRSRITAQRSDREHAPGSQVTADFSAPAPIDDTALLFGLAPRPAAAQAGVEAPTAQAPDTETPDSETPTLESGTGVADTPPAGDQNQDQNLDPGNQPESFHEFRKLLDEASLDGIRHLLASGELDVNGRDSSDRTPLMVATARGDPEAVRLLIDAGARLELTDHPPSGWSALIHAVRSRSRKRVEIISMLIAAGADVDQVCGHNRRTALMHAAEADVHRNADSSQGFAVITKGLIHLGADLEAKDRRGYTVWRQTKRNALGARTSSAYRRHLHQMLRVLEQSGAKPMAPHRV